MAAIPPGSLPAVGSVLSTDIIPLSRDGINLLRATIAQLFASPALSGNPTAPTQAAGNSSTRIASTAFVQAALLNLGLTTDDIEDLTGIAGSPDNLTNALVALNANKQPLDTLLTNIAALTFGADNYIYGTGSDTPAVGTVTSVARTLLAQATQALMRTNGLGAGATGAALFAAANTAAAQTAIGNGTIATQAANNVTITGGSIAGITDLAPADGGTGLSSYAVGDLLYASGTATLAKLADVATGQVLRSGGVGAAPAYGVITAADITTVLASPPAIGGATPAAVTGTSLTASAGALTVSGGNIVRNGTVTANASLINNGGALQSSDTAAQYAILNNPSFGPQGATLVSLYTQFNVNSLNAGSSAITQWIGAFNRQDRTAGFAGSLANLYANVAAAPSWGSGGPTGLYSAYQAANPAFPTPPPLQTAFNGQFSVATGTWNAYMNGTADNAFAGKTKFGDVVAPTAKVHIAAGSATANTAPLQLTSGAFETVDRAGTVQYNGNFHLTSAGLVRFVPPGTIAVFTTNSGNTTTTETTLRTVTLVASALQITGDGVEYVEHISVANTVATKTQKVKFGPAGSETTIFDSGAMAGSTASEVSLVIRIERISSSAVRCSVSPTLLTALSPPYTEITGLTLTNAMSLIITSQSGVGGATNDTIARLGRAEFKPGI